ncbi:VTT domain-containing protein [Hyphococcus flavus]|uniref:TVP38/TMEM64 family membrane protein n=1 Tax=Hyphococcus flavus TaxID=1866326 RepID=A0AAE9ZCN6_9PROT|nr:VTT domain-containing protein [Hyphococcus flavus]WDI32056.1 VTT domain-containing protein [Hyphococcus flavus]
MFEFLRRLGRFLNAMDAKAITSLAVSVILLIFVVLMLAYGQQWFHLEQENEDKLNALLAQAAESPFAVFGVISIFAFLALTGFPQILLITATVIVFGPKNGAIYSWIATMASATLTFGLGHFLGGRWLRRFGTDRVQRTINFIGRHGILASGLIRVVPSAPFVVVNAAAGAAHIPMWKYWTGTGIGIIPKIVMVAALMAVTHDPEAVRTDMGGVVEFFTSREPRDLALVAGIIALWLAFLVFVRWLYRRLRRQEN